MNDNDNIYDERYNFTIFENYTEEDFERDRKEMKEHSYKRHGGAYDRGSADSYYGRPREPHFYAGASYTTDKITDLTDNPKAIRDYNQGYDDQEKSGIKKQY